MVDQQHCIVAVVDDDPRVRESLENLFDSAGLETRSFTSAEEALLPGKLESICCMVTDVRMSGIGGCELHRMVATAIPSLPVIFVTAHHDEEVRRNMLIQGAFAFLYKPFDGEELLNTVSAALVQSHAQHFHS